MAELPWTRPEWLAEADAWISGELERLGLARAGDLEQIHVQHWSTVIRVPTSDGHLYFKAVSPVHAFEPRLTELLGRLHPDRVPDVVAVDGERSWMLMNDAGVRLRELMSSPADLWRWEAILPQYAGLQVDAASHAEELLALGVPDRRLAHIPALLERVLGERDLLVGGEDGLTEAELERVRAALPGIGAMCAELAAVGIPETIQHDDLHDGNVFVEAGRYLVFDWGDSCVSHPFHTLVVTLRAIAWKLGLEPGDAALERLRDAYLEAWTRFAPAAELRDAFALAYRTGTIGRALAWHDFVSAREPAFRDEDAGAVPYGLRLFLADGPIGSWR